jgi:hypothetical protein
MPPPKAALTRRDPGLLHLKSGIPSFRKFKGVASLAAGRSLCLLLQAVAINLSVL